MRIARERKISREFSDCYWKARHALERRDVAKAALHLVEMKALREMGARQFIDDEMLSRFDQDITRIERQIAGHDDNVAA